MNRDTCNSCGYCSDVALFYLHHSDEMKHHCLHQQIQGVLGARSPCPRFFFKIMQFSGNFEEKPPIFEKILGSGPSWGKNSAVPSVTKVLDPPLVCLLLENTATWRCSPSCSSPKVDMA